MSKVELLPRAVYVNMKRHELLKETHRQRVQVFVDQVVTPRPNQHLPHHDIQAQSGSQPQFVQPPVGEGQGQCAAFSGKCEPSCVLRFLMGPALLGHQST